MNYSEIFGDDWQKALTFIEENNYWIRPAFEKHNIPYHVAVAIFFPELVRYSALRDKMEIATLKALYRNLGTDYANFSVGVFQIKPSFAEQIRAEAPAAMGRKVRELFKKRSTYKSEWSFRASIITDLENPETEINYIIGFLKICESRFGNELKDDLSKIKFLATAYNAGFLKSYKEIDEMSDRKFFNTKLLKAESYSYSDVALYWYNQYTDNRK